MEPQTAADDGSSDWDKDALNKPRKTEKYGAFASQFSALHADGETGVSTADRSAAPPAPAPPPPDVPAEQPPPGAAARSTKTPANSAPSSPEWALPTDEDGRERPRTDADDYAEQQLGAGQAAGGVIRSSVIPTLDNFVQDEGASGEEEEEGGESEYLRAKGLGGSEPPAVDADAGAAAEGGGGVEADGPYDAVTAFALDPSFDYDDVSNVSAHWSSAIDGPLPAAYARMQQPREE